MLQIIRTIIGPWLSLILLLSVLSACTARQDYRAEEMRLVTAFGAETESESPPLFLLPGWQHPYNRIGRVQARRHGRHDHVFVEPGRAVIYQGLFSFTGRKGNSYTNQIFRVHFSGTPFSLIPFHLGAGDNIGVLVVITRDSRNRPLLVTTVNTCGCYVAVIPTSYLPAEAFPPDWPIDKQHVFGEVLPSKLDMTNPEDAFLITIRPAVHRVMDVRVAEAAIMPEIERVEAGIQPLSALKTLPLSDGLVTSMYYDKWPLKGHVKGAIKPWESLLLSLVSLDFYVGMDKEYGSTEEIGNPFYTSLKPWNRKRSDMNNFADFLLFMGWQL
jgi:hypothetical protein